MKRHWLHTHAVGMPAKKWHTRVSMLVKCAPNPLSHGSRSFDQFVSSNTSVKSGTPGFERNKPCSLLDPLPRPPRPIRVWNEALCMPGSAGITGLNPTAQPLVNHNRASFDSSKFDSFALETPIHRFESITSKIFTCLFWTSMTWTRLPGLSLKKISSSLTTIAPPKEHLFLLKLQRMFLLHSVLIWI